MNVPTLALQPDLGPSCIFQVLPQRDHVQPDGRTWRDQLPLKIVGDEPTTDRLMQPHGSAMPWHAMAFASRHTELSWLIESQKHELAPLAQEFAANGLSASSLSSSFDDDDQEAAEISEHRTRRIAYDPDPVELAARQRRYEFDQYLLGCSQPRKVFVEVTSDGKRRFATNDVRVTPDELAATGDEIRARLGTLPSADDIARAKHYQRVVWAAMTPAQQESWQRRSLSVQMYLEQADATDRDAWPLREEREAPQTANQELGLHSLDSDVDYQAGFGIQDLHPGRTYEVLLEPSEFELWPEEAYVL